MKYITSIFAFFILLTGCSTSDNDPPHELGENHEPEFVLVDLSEGGLPLSLKLNHGTSVEMETRWNSAFGRMELSNSYGMSIFIFEDTLTCATKKEEIEAGIFDISYIIETDTLIFYKSTLPDGSNPYWHFFASFPVGNSHYIFENNPLVECTEGQIRAMTDLIGKIDGLHKEAE